MAKYIFVTGGVVSGLGKGIMAASLGLLLKERGLKVFVQKFDPYLNVDPGTMSPLQHGEVFVTADGWETDLDLGHYERFIDTELTKNSSITSGRIYMNIISKERRGDYLGGTVQVVPHVTNEIKSKVYQAGEDSQADIVITEIGGTVGDIESLPFIETIRQIRSELGKEHVLFVHTTLVPVVTPSYELKTKPTQHSVKELRSFGVQPDIIVCRSTEELGDDLKEKIALFCDVPKQAVIAVKDEKILYQIPLEINKQNFDSLVCKQFGFKNGKVDLSKWKELISRIKKTKKIVTIALVGKYTQLKDAYLSVSEALYHAGYNNSCKVDILWVDSDTLNEANYKEILNRADGILVPGGFGGRAIEGKILAIRYAREQKVPFLGICLGLQLAVIEFSRHVCGWSEADSTEWNPTTPTPIIDIMENQKDLHELGGTMRLGNYPCHIPEKTLAHRLYQQTDILERHRHRYELNNEYRNPLISKGLVISGTSPDNRLVEMIELSDHPYFIATQAHPEFKSRPLRPHPLFDGLIQAACKNR